MVFYDQDNGGPVAVFFRHGMVSGLCGELVLFQGIGIKIKDKIVLQGFREGYCEYGTATGIILYWAYDVLNELYLTCSSGLMSSKAIYFHEQYIRTKNVCKEKSLTSVQTCLMKYTGSLQYCFTFFLRNKIFLLMLFSAKAKYVWENKQNCMSVFIKIFLQIWFLYLQSLKY